MIKMTPSGFTGCVGEYLNLRGVTEQNRILRSSIVVLLTKRYGDRIKEDGMGVTCSVHGEKKNSYRIFV
jgi:hypothetical protein